MENAFEYIVNRNPNGARIITAKYGMEPVTNEGLLGSVYQMIEQYGDPAIADMFSVHPDGPIIYENFNSGQNRNGYRNATASRPSPAPPKPTTGLEAMPVKDPLPPPGGGVGTGVPIGTGQYGGEPRGNGGTGNGNGGTGNGNGGTGNGNQPPQNGGYEPTPGGCGYGGGGGGGAGDTPVEDDLSAFQEEMNILSCEQLKTELGQLEEYAQVTRMTEEEAGILDQERNIIQTLIAEKCAVNGDGRSRTAKVLMWAAIIGGTLWLGSKMKGSK